LLEPGNSFDIYEEFILSAFIFREIEKVRYEREVPVDVTIETLQILTKGGDQVNLSDFSYGGAHIRQKYDIPERKWLEMASVLGYRDYAIFEIPIPKAIKIKELETAIKRIEEAQQLYYEGVNEAVITKCRKAFESINLIIRETPKLESEIDLCCPGEKNEPKKSERVEDLRKKLWKFLQIGPHEGYNITREDAEYILFLSLSTIRYYSRLLTKLSENP
jgi:hypothetical protein